LSFPLSELDYKRTAEPVLGPATRSVELFYLDIQQYGAVRSETVKAVLDEEQTNAAEDIARVKAKHAVVPRTYYQKGESIIDVHGVDLGQVFEGGVKWAEAQAATKRPGADWELGRRQAEARNYKEFIKLPAGKLFVEISSTPNKPHHELSAQGYDGMTHVRVSAKDESLRVKQLNIILPSSEPRFLTELQKILGTPDGQISLDSQEILARPKVLVADEDLSQSLKEVENRCFAALYNSDVNKSVIHMLKQAADTKKQGWDFVSSPTHADLNRELAQKLTELAMNQPAEWLEGIERIRAGYMKELRERFDGKARQAEHGSIIDAAAAQAVADSDVFITCGGVIEASSKSGSQTSASAVANALLNEVKGSGTCMACGASGTLWGCGVFCGECNRIWCEEYKRSNGKTELSYEEIRYRRHIKLEGQRPGQGFIYEVINGVVEEFRQWNRQYSEQLYAKKLAGQSTEPKPLPEL